jgi:mono/diheme cytochrome c family protein
MRTFGGASRYGPPSMSEPREPSRANQRLITLGVIVMFVFGLVVPAIVLAHNGADQASTADGVHLNKDEVKGRELFALKCTGCHTLAAVKSVGRIGPDLDVRVGGLPNFEERRALVLSAILEGRALGLGNMPEELYQGKEAEDVADFVAAVAGHT